MDLTHRLDVFCLLYMKKGPSGRVTTPIAGTTCYRHREIAQIKVISVPDVRSPQGRLSSQKDVGPWKAQNLGLGLSEVAVTKQRRGIHVFGAKLYRFCPVQVHVVGYK
jgi:hypothetical protein